MTLAVPAEREVTEAAQWYESQRDSLGTEFLEEMDSVLQDISRHPRRNRLVRGRIRSRRMVRFPYRILYEDRPDDVHVVALSHFRRDPDYWVNRI